MALVRNIILHTSPGTQSGALAQVRRHPNLGAMRGFYDGAGTREGGAPIADTAARPQGYTAPGAWVLPPKPGGMAARNRIHGAGDIAPLNLQGGLYGEAAILGDVTLAAPAYGVGTVTSAVLGDATVAAVIEALGQLAAAVTGSGDVTDALISSAITGAANLTGSGEITNAALGLIVTALADLAGSGTVGADMSSVIVGTCAIVGSCSLSPEAYGAMIATANLAGTGDLVAAIQALGNAVAAITASADVAGSLNAPATMSADIAATGDVLTTQSIAAAVWNALAAQFAAAGTMGEAVQGGGGALSPTQATMLRELYELMGLDPTKPLVVDDTGNTRRVPADGSSIDQTVVTSGGETTVTRV